MNFQAVLALNLMALSTLSLLLGRMGGGRGARSFALLNLFVLLLGGYGLWRLPDDAGNLVALVFVPLVAAPLTLHAFQERFARAGRLDAAARCADLAALLHPSPDMRLSAAVARASAIEDPRERARAFSALAAEAPAEQAAVIETRLLADRGDWERALALTLDPENARPLAAYRLRALGETGRVEEMIQDYARSVETIPVEQTAFAWLFVLAFGGRPKETEALANRLMRLGAETADYWIATAQRHAGDEAGARAIFEGLAVSRRETMATMSARRQLARDWTPPEPLSPAALDIVEGVAARVMKESARREQGFRLPPATLALILVNALVFAAEVALGGSQNAETLIRLGALWAPYALHGESWRILSAAFLHYGALHFALNMMMLALIGRELEQEAGAARLLVAYLGGAAFSSFMVLALMARGVVGYGLYVGASGAIFAAFGVIVVFRMKDWRSRRASLDALRARALGLAMLVQLGADFLLPMSSLTAHLSGFGFGLLLGLFYRRPAQPR